MLIVDATHKTAARYSEMKLVTVLVLDDNKRGKKLQKQKIKQKWNNTSLCMTSFMEHWENVCDILPYKKGEQRRHIIHKNNHTFSPTWQRDLPHEISRPLRSWEDVHLYVLGLLWVSQSLPVKWSVCFAGQSALWRECVVVFVISYMPTKLESFDINCPIAIQENASATMVSI